MIKVWSFCSTSVSRNGYGRFFEGFWRVAEMSTRLVIGSCGDVGTIVLSLEHLLGGRIEVAYLTLDQILPPLLVIFLVFANLSLCSYYNWYTMFRTPISWTPQQIPRCTPQIFQGILKKEIKTDFFCLSMAYWNNCWYYEYGSLLMVNRRPCYSRLLMKNSIIGDRAIISPLERCTWTLQGNQGRPWWL